MPRSKAPLDDGLDARSLPHNLDAERSVLGTILINNAVMNIATQALRPDDFYRDAHRRIFTAMSRLIDEQRGVADFVTLKEELLRVGDLDEVGGPAYISALADGIPRNTNITYYASIVREKALLRGIIFAANATLVDAYAAEEPAEELLAAADRRFLDVISHSKTGTLVDVRDGLADLSSAIEHRVSHRGELLGITTGFTSLDDLTLGWQPGDLTVVAARPSIGKTTFVLNSAVASAQQGKRVALFSLEMRRRQLEYRMLSSLSGVDLTRILTGYLGHPDYAKLAHAMELLHQLPIAINDRSGQRVEHVRAACRRLRAEKGLDLVVVDYVQLMPGSLNQKTTRNEQVTDISRRMKDLADEVQAPVLLLSQLNRAGDKRADSRPRLADLRESGALEQDADNVLFLHRETHRAGGLTECILEKQRNGPTGAINLTLDRDIVTFRDAGKEAAPTPQPAELPGMEKRAEKRKPRGHF